MEKEVHSGRQHSRKRQRRRRSKKQRRIFALLCLLLAIAVLANGIAVARNFYGAKSYLLRGQDSVELAKQAAGEADFAKAVRHLKQSEQDLFNAREKLNSASINMLAPLPIIGQNVAALRHLCSSGLEAVSAGESLLQGYEKVLGEQEAAGLIYSDGRINLSLLAAMRPFAEQADLHAVLASAEYRKIPDTFLLGPIEEAKEKFGSQLAQLKALTFSTDQAFKLLPGILGANGKRRYFLAVQNNAELRATGGLIGNYGVIEAENGKLSLSSFNEIGVLIKEDRAPAEAPKDFSDRYGRLKGASTWQSINMSPDFPTVGEAILGLYKNTAADSLDGVISIDPIGLKYLLKAVGPVHIPEAGTDINAGNVVSWTLVDAYSQYPERKERKNFLAIAARAVWLRLVSGQISDKSALAGQLSKAFSEKHMVFFSSNKREQELAEEAGYSGKLASTQGDYLQVLLQNHGANKIDVYAHERISYFIKLGPDGSGLANLAVTLENKAPAVGLPAYVAGKNPLGTKGGYSNTWINIYLPGGAQLLKTTARDDDDAEVDFEKGKTVFSQYVELAPGASRTIKLLYQMPGAIIRNGGQRKYALIWQLQPVVNNPNIDLRVLPPEGFQFKELPAGFAKKGREAFYSGELSRDKSFVFTLADQ